jgi:hypothetical protein
MEIKETKVRLSKLYGSHSEPRKDHSHLMWVFILYTLMAQLKLKKERRGWEQRDASTHETETGCNTRQLSDQFLAIMQLTSGDQQYEVVPESWSPNVRAAPFCMALLAMETSESIYENNEYSSLDCDNT